MGGPMMGIAKSSNRRGAETTCADPVHKVVTQGAGPGSVWSWPEYALSAAFVPSSQTFRHDSLALFESSWWPAEALGWASNSTGAWLAVATDSFAALACDSGVSRKQAFATPEANANSHTNNIANAVLRLVWVSAKNIMVWDQLRSLMLGLGCTASIDLHQMSGALATGCECLWRHHSCCADCAG